MAISSELLALIDRMTEEQRRLFACDCAEHVIHWYEQTYPEIESPRLEIEIARQYANGEASIEDLRGAKNGIEVTAYNAQYQGTNAAGAAIGVVEANLYCQAKGEMPIEDVAFIVEAAQQTVEIAVDGGVAFDLIRSDGEAAVSAEKLQRLYAARTEQEKWQIERATFYVSG